jgi:hypothetical protein
MANISTTTHNISPLNLFLYFTSPSFTLDLLLWITPFTFPNRHITLQAIDTPLFLQPKKLYWLLDSFNYKALTTLFECHTAHPFAWIALLESVSLCMIVRIDEGMDNRGNPVD